LGTPGGGEDKPKRGERGRALEDAPQTWLEMWALCRREHGLTWHEFQELTLAGFEALEERRAIELRHARFNAALVTSTIYNANRGPDSEPLSPFDLIAGFEEDPEEVERRKMRQSVKQAVVVAFMEMAKEKKTAEQIQAEKTKMVARMKASGFEDAEDIVREACPDL